MLPKDKYLLYNKYKSRQRALNLNVYLNSLIITQNNKILVITFISYNILFNTNYNSTLVI